MRVCAESLPNRNRVGKSVLVESLGGVLAVPICIAPGGPHRSHAPPVVPAAMGSSRRLALLASRAWTAARPRSELASGAVAARARGFAAVPATNDDDYKRLKAAKSSITVRARRLRRVAWQACRAARREPTPHVRRAASPR